MSYYRHTPLSFAGLLLLAPFSFAATVYSVTPLTDLPANAFAQSINNNLEVGGIFDTNVNTAAFVPFVATTTVYTQLANPTGLSRTEWTAVNDSGAIGGWGINSSDFEQAYIGTVATASALALPSGYVDVTAEGFDDSGELAVTALTATTFINFPGTATTSGTTVLTTGNSGDTFNGNNSLGWATGSSTAGKAIFWNGSVMASISLGANFTTMTGEGINTAGHICGSGTNSGNTEAFYYNGSTTTAISLLTGFTSADLGPQCISSNNVIVGSLNNSSGDFEAFIWDPTDGVQALSAVALGGWTFTEALAIDSNGDILAEGTNGIFSGYEILTAQTTPEPSAAMLTGVAVLILLRRRWSQSRRSKAT